jgi:hypothetical protein
MATILSTLGQFSVILHVIAGFTTLIAGPIAIFANRRHVRLHRIAGMSFFWAMNWVCISAIMGYFRHPNQIFYAFLLGIAILVYAGILRGVRAIQLMKGGQVSKLDFIWIGALAICSVWMLGKGVQAGMAWEKSGMFAILFGVFGIGALSDTVRNIKYFTKPELVEKGEWLRLHVSTMLGAFIASTTAFTVNTAHYLPWYIQWFGPTLLLLPLQIYWRRKLKMKKPVLAV